MHRTRRTARPTHHVMPALTPIFDYFGAHKVVDRALNERDRALQRFLFPTLLIPLGIWAGHLLGLTDKGLFGPFTILPMMYGLLGLAYYFFIARNPSGGVGAQYAFLICDPIATEAAIAYEPAAFSWMSIVLFVVITRAGVRYGMRTLLLTWVSAIVGAVALYIFVASTSAAWQDSKHTYLVVGYALLMGVPLFMPVIKQQSRSRELEMDRLKVAALADNIRDRNEFLSRVGHELRSPLQAIISSLAMLEDREAKLDSKTRQRLIRAATGISRQLGDLLTLARGEAGKLSITPTRTSINDLFQDALASASEIAEEKGLSLCVNISDPEAQIILDAGRVAQIADNLLINALKYTETGSIAFTVEPLDDIHQVLRFSVVDTGLGIDKKQQDRIFNQFERGENTGRDNSSGSAGIGLAVVKTLVANLGGELGLNSTQGQGSTFRVQIPFATPEPRQPTVEETRILVVDDRKDVLDALSSVIANAGYSVDTAPSAGVARNLITAQKYGVILIDLEMPIVTGVEFAREIRRVQGVNSNSHLIAVTAGENEEPDSDWPFEKLLRKPISARKLRSTIASLQ